MSQSLIPLIRGRAPIPAREALRAGAGALLGVGFCGLAARLVMDGRLSATPLLVAPIGASAVLAFALPASPLAQPRSVIGGNMLAAIVGVACALLIPQAAVAAAAAVGLSVLLMALLGCLHPPGGAIALGAALAGHELGFAYAVAPVGICSLLLVVAAALYARATGHSYPHRVLTPVNPHATRDAPAADRVGFTPADLDQALAHYGDLLDVSREDLDQLFRQVELQAHQRIHSQIRCGDIMSRDLIVVDVRQSCESALAYLRQHDLRTAPVIDAERKVVGMVRRAELAANRGRLVEDALDPFVHRVKPGTAIEALLPLLSGGVVHEAMVVDDDRKLVGIITQTDLLAVLYRAHIVEAVAAGARDPAPTAP